MQVLSYLYPLTNAKLARSEFEKREQIFLIIDFLLWTSLLSHDLIFKKSFIIVIILPKKD